MKGLVVLLLAATCATAHARPLLISPKHLEIPLAVTPQYPNQFQTTYGPVAIDGDTVLVSASRVVDTSGTRVDGVHIFQRASNGTWNYAGPLVDGYSGFVALGGNVATLANWQGNGFEIYERGASGWSRTVTLSNGDTPLRVENGTIYTRGPNSRPTDPSSRCQQAYGVYRKVNGSWRKSATFGGERCGYEYVQISNGTALIVNIEIGFPTQVPAELYREVNGTWQQVASVQPPNPNPNYVNWFGAGGVSGNLMVIEPYLFRDVGSDSWVQAGILTEPDVDLGMYRVRGQPPVLRGPNLFMPADERDYQFPSHDMDIFIDKNTLRVYRPSANGTMEYFARLNPDYDLWNWVVSNDGRRVVGVSPDNDAGYDPVTRLYVFEIPDSHTFPFLQQDTFASGNFARWTPHAGQFSVVQNGASRVLRQNSLSGDSGATLTSVDWTDQAIEADLRPLEFAEAGRWFGLVTRRTDAGNYYYVTFRSPRTISIRRVRNGVVTEIGYGGTPEPLVPGQSYRVRFESIGEQHVVFLDGLPRAVGRDATLTHGHPGVAGYRTRFDVDNVVVTGGTRVLTVHDSVDTYFHSDYSRGTGNWTGVVISDEEWAQYSHVRQTDTAGDARHFSRTPLANQVVSARLRPLSYGATTGTQDPWFGVAARVVDDRNFLYLSLRRTNQLSLRKVVNGAIQVIANVPITVTPNQWYDLRLEVVGGNIRAFVNGDLKIETTDGTLAPTGRSGVVMYKTAADLWSYITYQP